MLDALQAQLGAVDRVLTGDRQLRMVIGRTHPQLVHLVDRGGKNLGRGAKELDPISPGATRGADPVARRLGRGGAFGEQRVGNDARRGNRPRRPLPAQLGSPLQAHHRADIAHRGDPVGQQQLQHIVGIGQLPAVEVDRGADVFVSVDEAGQHIAPLPVDHPGAGFGRRRAIRRPAAHRARAADVGDPHDAIARNLDIDRAEGRRAGAVDHHHIGDHQSLERPGSLGPMRRGRARPGNMRGAGNAGDDFLARRNCRGGNRRGSARRHSRQRQRHHAGEQRQPCLGDSVMKHGGSPLVRGGKTRVAAGEAQTPTWAASLCLSPAAP